MTILEFLLETAYGLSRTTPRQTAQGTIAVRRSGRRGSVSEEWGRKKDAGQWLKSAHAWAIATTLLAVAVLAAISAYRFAYSLTASQRF